MPQVAGVAVAGWFGSAAAGAIASAVVTGAIVGAVIGAATAVMSGGDIFKGALKGALIGGISGGILKGAGILTGISPVGKAFTDAAAGITTPTGNVGANIGVQGGVENIPKGNAPTFAPDGSIQVGAKAPTGILSTTPPVVEAANTSKDSIYAGLLEGIGTGVGVAGAELVASGEDKEIAEFQAQQEAQLRSQNVPGEFESKTANITPPDWWDAHLNPNLA